MSNLNIQETDGSYRSIDTILTITLFLIIIIANFVIGKIIILNFNYFSSEVPIFCITGIYFFLITGIVFIFCRLRRQKLSTIGISTRNIGKSLLIGVIGSVFIIITRGILYEVSLSAIRNNISLVIMRIIYFLLFISFTEEVAFRGYIGTRLLTHQRFLSVLITGIMFSLVHIPFHMTITQMSILNYVEMNWANIFSYLISHFIFQWIYSKYNNLAGPVLFHFVIDFSGWLVQLN